MAASASSVISAREASPSFKIMGFSISRSLLIASAKVVMWFLLLASITFTPIMMKLSFVPYGQEASNPDKYTAATVQATAFFLTIVVGYVIVFALYGKQGIRKCFWLVPLLWMFPVSAGYSLSEMIAATAMGSASPMIYATVHKLRLLLTAFMTRTLLKRRVTKLKWTMCFMITTCVLIYVFHSKSISNKPKPAVKVDPNAPVHQENSTKAILMLVLNISISCVCAVGGEFVSKRLNNMEGDDHIPFPVQMVLGRYSAFAGSTVIALVYQMRRGWLKYGWFGGPGGGWDRYNVALVFFNIGRDWINSAVLLVLDALYKSLAGSCAVATTYLIQPLVFRREEYNFLQSIMVLAIVIAVVVYALTEKLEKSNRKLIGLQKQLKDNDAAKMRELERLRDEIAQLEESINTYKAEKRIPSDLVLGIPHVSDEYTRAAKTTGREREEALKEV